MNCLPKVKVKSLVCMYKKNLATVPKASIFIKKTIQHRYFSVNIPSILGKVF